MPAPKSAKVRDEVIALAKQGHSARVIEGMLGKRKLKMGKSAIAELVRQYRSGAVPEPAAKALPVPSAAPSNPTAPTSPSSPPLPATPPIENGGLDPAEVADLDLGQLAKLAELFDERLRAAVKTGDVRLAGWLLGARRTVSQEISRLRPPVLPDPAKDPANVIARDELRARLVAAVASYHQSAAGRAQLRAHLELVESGSISRFAEAAE